MNRYAIRLKLVVVLVITIGLILVSVVHFRRNGGPLNKMESQLVGCWLNIDGEVDEPGAGVTFKAGRTFFTNDQHFIGRWRAASGHVHINYTGVRSWTGNTWYQKLFNGLRFRRANSGSFEINFDKDGTMVEFEELGAAHASRFVRASE